ncbi:MAG: hypothetical protein JWP49_2457 [Phenylobacterium sp.]|jgi:hypothetical protein|nr:hypothetical protein [Phenylobacterium sp.]
MSLRTLLLIAAVFAATGATAAPKPAPHKAPAKPAATAAPAAGHVGAIAGGPADTRDPATLIAVFDAAGATAQTAHKEADSVLVAVSSRFASFSVQYAGCDPAGKGCKAALLDSQAVGTPTLAQLNSFNQASAMCRGYVDRNGKAHVLMSLLLFGDDTREHLVTQLAAWQGCIADFSAFAKDPVAYLASAP